MLDDVVLIMIGVVIGILLRKILCNISRVFRIISIFLIYVVLPLTIIYVVSIHYFDIMHNIAYVGFIVLIIVTTSAITSKWLSILLEVRSSTKTVVMCSMNWNALILPLPIVLYICGLRGVAYVSIIASIQIALIPLMCFLAEILSGEYSSRTKYIAKKYLIFPPTIASMIGIIFGIASIDMYNLSMLFDVIRKLLLILPLILIGMTLGPSSIRISREHIIVAITRFIIAPLTILLLVVNLDRLIATVVIIESIMPPALINIALVEDIKMDPQLTTSLIATLNIFTIIIFFIIIVSGL